MQSKFINKKVFLLTIIILAYTSIAKTEAYGECLWIFNKFTRASGSPLIFKESLEKCANAHPEHFADALKRGRCRKRLKQMSLNLNDKTVKATRKTLESDYELHKDMLAAVKRSISHRLYYTSREEQNDPNKRMSLLGRNLEEQRALVDEKWEIVKALNALVKLHSKSLES